jgi:hypothetical protein
VQLALMKKSNRDWWDAVKDSLVSELQQKRDQMTMEVRAVALRLLQDLNGGNNANNANGNNGGDRREGMAATSSSTGGSRDYKGKDRDSRREGKRKSNRKASRERERERDRGGDRDRSRSRERYNGHNSYDDYDHGHYSNYSGGGNNKSSNHNKGSNQQQKKFAPSRHLWVGNAEHLTDRDLRYSLSLSLSLSPPLLRAC